MDIDGIVQRIQGLKVDDSKYAVCYFKLLEARPTVAQLLPSPFQHMRSLIVQQAAMYPNSIPISGQRARSPNCHFCGKPGCRIGTCNTVNDYIKAGRVIRKGRMVLYSDKGSIAWNSQGLKILVDIRFGGPLPIPTVVSAPETTMIQTMFVSCLPKAKQVVSAIIQEEDRDDVPVATLATTRSKTKEKATNESPPLLPTVITPGNATSAMLAKRMPAYMYDSKAILLDAIKSIK